MRYKSNGGRHEGYIGDVAVGGRGELSFPFCNKQEDQRANFASLLQEQNYESILEFPEVHDFIILKWAWQGGHTTPRIYYVFISLSLSCVSAQVKSR